MDELLLVFCYFFQFLTLGTGTVCLFTFGISAAVFLERAIQRIYQLLLSSIASIVALFSLLFISVQYFNNGVSIYVCYFDRLESLLNEMHFHDLNESYDSYEFAGPGPSLMRCSFTKSNVMLFSLKVSHSPGLLVRLVRVESWLSRPEQVVSIGHDWLKWGQEI